MSKHTPVPWIVRGKPGNRFIRTEIIGGKATTVAWIDSLDAEAELPNAEFIVRACNSHHDLLAALEAMVERAIPCAKHWKDDASIVAARAAIAKAKGTS